MGKVCNKKDKCKDCDCPGKNDCHGCDCPGKGNCADCTCDKKEYCKCCNCPEKDNCKGCSGNEKGGCGCKGKCDCESCDCESCDCESCDCESCDCESCDCESCDCKDKCKSCGSKVRGEDENEENCESCGGCGGSEQGGCTGDCSSCGHHGSCGDEKESMICEPHKLSKIKKVIGVVSGKGGVGKSMVTSMLAVMMNRKGYSTAILDADVTGPSIPKMFGITAKASADEMGLYPVPSKTGINVMSVNLLLENESDPVVWRGPVIAGAVKQFWTDVIWGDVDFMFVDMPPGTGDVPLTVFQSIPVDGIIIVTSPQELVSMIVGKAVKMAELMEIPVLGIVENMSYFECPDCGKRHSIYGESHVDQIADKYGIKTIAKMPINPKFAAAADKGCVELFESDCLDGIAGEIEN